MKGRLTFFCCKCQILVPAQDPSSCNKIFAQKVTEVELSENEFKVIIHNRKRFYSEISTEQTPLEPSYKISTE